MNSMHLWAVECFFFFMVVHLWCKYWIAAWRGGRKLIWVTGCIIFLTAIPCALTGYVVPAEPRRAVDQYTSVVTGSGTSPIARASDPGESAGRKPS